MLTNQTQPNNPKPKSILQRLLKPWWWSRKIPSLLGVLIILGIIIGCWFWIMQARNIPETPPASTSPAVESITVEEAVNLLSAQYPQLVEARGGADATHLSLSAEDIKTTKNGWQIWVYWGWCPDCYCLFEAKKDGAIKLLEKGEEPWLCEQTGYSNEIEIRQNVSQTENYKDKNIAGICADELEYSTGMKVENITDTQKAFEKYVEYMKANNLKDNNLAVDWEFTKTEYAGYYKDLTYWAVVFRYYTEEGNKEGGNSLIYVNEKGEIMSLMKCGY